VGRPGVTDLITDDGVQETDLLAWAATVERASEHPLAGAVVEEASRRGLALSDSPLQEFHSHTGRGVHARVDGNWIGVGREDLFETHDLPASQASMTAAAKLRREGKTALIVRTDRGGGVIGVADQIRPEAASAIAALKRLGIARVVMLTGDNELVAREVARTVGADEALAGLMPDQKVREIKRLSGTTDRVAMAGDGVNDAPALAAAHVGIAMGSGGVDVALETADVALMRDDLRTLPFALWISRVARRRVRQNLIFAFGMIAALVLATFFELPLWLGVLGHEGSTVIVILNGIRLLWARNPEF
jgi:Cd2+/Zn2+-exporting ATPase